MTKLFHAEYEVYARRSAHLLPDILKSICTPEADGS